MNNAVEEGITSDILPPPSIPMGSDEHPDSKYDNWTIRSYDCKTPIEDIPSWMRIYAESSIETHTFFKFERYEYPELNAWQNMLLKLYRKDLNNVIKYYEDYRASLLTEICSRASETTPTEPTEVEGVRHDVCDQTTGQSPETKRSNRPASPSSLEVSKIISQFEKLEEAPPTQQRQFKRFGKRCASKENSIEGEEAKPRSASEPASTPHQTSPQTSPPLLSKEDKEDSPDPKDVPQRHNSNDFDPPLLKRSPGKRMTKLRASYMHPSHYDQNISNNTDYPSPLHIRSASSRQTPRDDLPSPYLNRSSSDRPKNYSMYNPLKEGLSKDTLSWSSDEGGSFRRGSCKRSSGGIKILSPKLKRKSEPGSQRVKYIEPESSNKGNKMFSKMLSRATSFGKKEKEKPPRYREKKEERKPRCIGREDKSEPELPRETAV